jgi:hypothetical protein
MERGDCDALLSRSRADPFARFESIHYNRKHQAMSVAWRNWRLLHHRNYAKRPGNAERPGAAAVAACSSSPSAARYRAPCRARC